MALGGFVRDDRDISITAIAENGRRFPIDKLVAHQDGGTLHLAISVFLYSERGVLLQQRAADKYHSGGLWANSVCSHPDWGEDIADCARRRCREELHIEAPLEALGVIDYRADVGGGLTEHERAHIFAGRVPVEAAEISPNPVEAAATRWIDRETLHTEMAEHPDRFTPWFRQYMSRDDPALRAMRELVWSRIP
ncbi:isopentenyl-diphosphate delta-isomerase [Palleronia aestuarii]|uniref:Isopentenyl-diphosphate Delta-isomerase n=1 Tax=Palleronia aestuarii TaxID=568105 RepID=A0A2W7NGJ7_9RHOB|nr:isopentenyl-diphosphate Delta-isomerase [Palleronia aestuarii]PZX15824.1 isopentenyl-diphosphate delta-isomerase [Palleronia aestuarii]